MVRSEICISRLILRSLESKSIAFDPSDIFKDTSYKFYGFKNVGVFEYLSDVISTLG